VEIGCHCRIARISHQNRDRPKAETVCKEFKLHNRLYFHLSLAFGGRLVRNAGCGVSDFKLVDRRLENSGQAGQLPAAMRGLLGVIGRIHGNLADRHNVPADFIGGHALLFRGAGDLDIHVRNGIHRGLASMVVLKDRLRKREVVLYACHAGCSGEAPAPSTGSGITK
jgi:hypothetical protein